MLFAAIDKPLITPPEIVAFAAAAGAARLTLWYTFALAPAVK